MGIIDKVIVQNENLSAPITAESSNYMKVGTTTEAAGLMHSLHAATGNPGAWSPGTPGLAGRATDGTTSTDNGCIRVQNATTGTNYLTNFSAAATTASMQMLLDILWVNTGTVVTTITAQTVNSVAFPARDDNEAVDGNGVMVGILVTTATTNAGVIANTTMSYTNSAGTAGKTATISSFPATAVAGTIILFQLATGDNGVQSIQSLTLGISYGGGAISLIAFRVVAMAPNLIANAGGNIQTSQGMPGINIILADGVCLIPAYIATATTATNVFGLVNVVEK